MKLRKRLTLYSTFTFGIVFFITSLVIFIAFYQKTMYSTISQLKNTTLLSGIYYLEQDELPSYEHSAIKEEFRATIQSVNVAIFNNKNKVEYGHLLGDENITSAILELVRNNKEYYFTTKDYFYHGIFYPDNQGDFVVFIKESKEDFNEQLSSLVLILLSVFTLGIISIYFLSKYLSNVAYKPFKKVIDQVNSINYNNFQEGIEVPDTKDELAELITTYNKLLHRLSEGIIIQKNFINYASHEFKTPLTAISGNLEVFAQKDRTPEEYKKVANDALENVYRIESILSNLLLLSGLNNKENTKEEIRIDEVVWDIFDALQPKVNKLNTQLNLQFEVKDFNILKIYGNHTLIHLALYNIIENAVKYSQKKPIDISLLTDNNRLKLIVKDYGRGIEQDDLPLVRQTFYRGKNVGDIKGHGIGLSLALRIFEQHNIEVDIQSKAGEGTCITLLF
ncbi:sensor histidine kinase [Myroides sp. LoEW2-1]|uniref:sensor histidine kinase n=1 Tax=Myroides sp. LoEW2-1 TaxID=2683192 RepID=UPI001320991A|nr:HAMP domain-containing sensor histidine kinase [Myroides sp. LoEW2-1]MVX35956.1 sensor histidine kinase [Myroides sp. LoEW2-1]